MTMSNPGDAKWVVEIESADGWSDLVRNLDRHYGFDGLRSLESFLDRGKEVTPRAMVKALAQCIPVTPDAGTPEREANALVRRTISKVLGCAEGEIHEDTRLDECVLGPRERFRPIALMLSMKQCGEREYRVGTFMSQRWIWFFGPFVSALTALVILWEVTYLVWRIIAAVAFSVLALTFVPSFRVVKFSSRHTVGDVAQMMLAGDFWLNNKTFVRNEAEVAQDVLGVARICFFDESIDPDSILRGRLRLSRPQRVNES